MLHWDNSLIYPGWFWGSSIECASSAFNGIASRVVFIFVSRFGGTFTHIDYQSNMCVLIYLRKRFTGFFCSPFSLFLKFIVGFRGSNWGSLMKKKKMIPKILLSISEKRILAYNFCFVLLTHRGSHINLGLFLKVGRNLFLELALLLRLEMVD